MITSTSKELVVCPSPVLLLPSTQWSRPPRAFAGSTAVEAVRVDGMVFIPLADYGTDGFGVELYVLHFPQSKLAVAMLVKR